MSDIEREIDELVNLAFRQWGGRGPTGSMVMREKAEHADPEISKADKNSKMKHTNGFRNTKSTGNETA